MFLAIQEFIQSSDCLHLKVTTLGISTLILMILLWGKFSLAPHHKNNLQRM